MQATRHSPPLAFAPTQPCLLSCFSCQRCIPHTPDHLSLRKRLMHHAMPSAKHQKGQRRCLPARTQTELRESHPTASKPNQQHTTSAPRQIPVMHITLKEVRLIGFDAVTSCNTSANNLLCHLGCKSIRQHAKTNKNAASTAHVT